MGTGLKFWYVVSPAWFWHAAMSSIGSFDEILALRATAKNIFRPVFQDYTFQGRLIGFFLRLGRIVAGLVMYFFILLFWMILLATWLLLPLLAISNALRFLL